MRTIMTMGTNVLIRRTENISGRCFVYSHTKCNGMYKPSRGARRSELRRCECACHDG